VTPRELIRQAAEAFRQAGIPDPEVDASLLLSHVTGKQELMLRLDAWTEVSPREEEAFAAMCRQRLTRCPLQYLLGEQSFYGRDFQVDSRVLIPRPETELLAEHAICDLKSRKAPAALDLCCGSGAIAVTLALEAPHAEVHACDLSPDALAVTKANAQRHQAPITLHQGDLFAAVEGFKFDVIVSNPPYIPTEDCLHLQQEVMQEPAMALDGGQDGYDFYRRIAHEAPAYLNPDGSVWLEVGFDQAPTVMALLKDAGFAYVASHEDYQHIARMVEGRLSPEET